MMLLLIFAILSVTGLLPTVLQAMRALRGDPEPGPGMSSSRTDLEMCFRLLGLSPSASWDEVERAYKQKAKKHHPDHGGDDDMMRTLNEAYAILKREHGRKR